MFRLVSLVAVATSLLTACDGDSGLEFKSPTVEVKALSGDDSLMVKLGDNQTLEFTEDGVQKFKPIKDNKAYTLILEGNENCSFWGEHHLNNDQRTRNTSNSNAAESFLIMCNVNEDGVIEE